MAKDVPGSLPIIEGLMDTQEMCLKNQVASSDDLVVANKRAVGLLGIRAAAPDSFLDPAWKVWETGRALETSSRAL